MSKQERPHPERIHLHEDRTPTSRLTYTWTHPVINKARRGVLTVDDFTATPSWIATEKSRDRFLHFWEQSKREGRGWVWIMLRFFKRDFTKNAIFSITADLILYIQPFIIKMLLEGINKGSPKSELYGAATVVIVLMMLRMVMVNYCTSKVFDMGYVARAAIIGAIYQKSLSFASGPRQKFCSGKGINILTSDTNKIQQVFPFINFTWILPLRISFAFICAYIYMGVYAIPGIAFVMVVIPSLYMMARKLKSLRAKLATAIDNRMGLTQESLGNIRVVKYLGLERFCKAKIDVERKSELSLLFAINSLTAVAGAIDFWAPIFAANLSIAATAYYGEQLEAGKVFAFLQIFSQLAVPLWVLPHFVAGLISCRIAAKRIDAMLSADRCPESLSITDGAISESTAISVERATFQWDSLPPDPNIKKQRKKKRQREHIDPTMTMTEVPRDLFSLHDMNLNIPKGALVAVIGRSGSGKSSLISALMGEMRIRHGTRIVQGSISLCPQSVWLLNGTIRDNILFGLPFEEKRYFAVLRQCTIDQDISSFPNGDQTMIGEKGATVSGGQRQRIGMARVAYAQSDIAFLDDPLSAVDANVGRALFYGCIKNGHLRQSTRILTTHHTGFLGDCDYIIVLEEGRIVAAGTYSELLSSTHPYVRTLMCKSPIPSAPQLEPSTPKVEDVISDDSCSVSLKSELKYKECVSRTASRSAVRVYLKALGGWPLAALLVILSLMPEVLKVVREHFLNEAMPAAGSPPLTSDESVRLALFYALFGTLQGFASCFVSVLAVFLCQRASKTIHEECIDRVLTAKLSVFDETPVGRILNRFGRDLDTIDTNFPDKITQFIVCISGLISAIILLSVYEPRFLPSLLVPLAATAWLQQRFRRAYRQLQQLTGITLGPIVSHFSESMSGLSSIRAFKQERLFINLFDKLNDQYAYTSVWLMSVRRWASLRSEAIWIVYLYGLLMICLAMEIKGQIVGLIFTYIFHNVEAVDWSMRQMAELESCVVSVERLYQYVMELEAEVDTACAPAVPLLKSSENFIWPSSGEVVFENVTVKYKPTLPPVINDFSFVFKPKHKIAIVGRSGAGKSTIIGALFSGRIMIDGVDIASISFKSLRNVLAMVPQDPVLFSGTLRSNLDPEGMHSDDKLWMALESIKMRTAVQEHPAKLDLIVDDSGSGFSVGQRQLICMARAILRGTKIIVLDEATSNLDRETEALMQESLMETFSHVTVITIAHRLETILNHDVVIVMGKGKILEAGSPGRLLRNKGEFASMLNAASVDTSGIRRCSSSTSI